MTKKSALPIIYFHTFGCRLNQSETATLENLFKEAGFTITSSKNSADIYIINTCTVTAKGDLDTRKLVNQIIRINPRAKIAIIGCQSQTHQTELLKLPNVSWIVGNACKMDLVNIISKSSNTPTQILTPAIGSEAFTIPATAGTKKRTRANLKIQDGCNYFCTYCEIPYARGRSRSRVFENILQEVQLLANQEYKEVILTGVNTGTYQYQEKTLLDVLKAINNIPGIERIRISSIEPKTVDSTLFDFMAKNPKICRHLHIPIQNCNNEILKAMNRIYTFEEFQQFLLDVKSKIADLCIGTDIIVGFPGETDAIFDETYKKLQNLPIDYFHVFSYSNRKFAKSKDLPNHISIQTIKKRSAMLRQLSISKRQQFLNSLLGRKMPVLFEEKKKGQWSGTTSQFVRVFVSSNSNLKNQIQDVIFQSVEGQSIIGQLI